MSHDLQHTDDELIESDIRLILRGFDVLKAVSARCEDAYSVELRIGTGDDREFVIGYGQDAEPALLAILRAGGALQEAQEGR